MSSGVAPMHLRLCFLSAAPLRCLSSGFCWSCFLFGFFPNPYPSKLYPSKDIYTFFFFKDIPVYFHASTLTNIFSFSHHTIRTCGICHTN